MALYHPRLHIVLFQPEIPQNTGNIGRTCVAVGAKLWLIRPIGFRMDESRLRRAGLDYWQSLSWESVKDWSDFDRVGPSGDRWYYTKSANQAHWNAQFVQGDVLVFGSETQGLPDSLIGANPDRCLRIPMRPDVRSLNLSNAVAIAAYDALRQFKSSP